VPYDPLKLYVPSLLRGKKTKKKKKKARKKEPGEVNASPTPALSLYVTEAGKEEGRKKKKKKGKTGGRGGARGEKKRGGQEVAEMFVSHFKHSTRRGHEEGKKRLARKRKGRRGPGHDPQALYLFQAGRDGKRQGGRKETGGPPQRGTDVSPVALGRA